jgi:hypothetical protein
MSTRKKYGNTNKRTLSIIIKVMNIKHSIFTLLCALACSSSIAQIQSMPAASHNFTVGVGGGATELFGDFATGITKYAGRVYIDYNFTPFITAGIEGQYGSLGAKGYYEDPNHRIGKISIVNIYNAADANVHLAVGQFLDYQDEQSKIMELVGGIYIGTGIGMINSNTTPTIIRNPGAKGDPLVGFHNTSSDIFIPANIGINIPLPRIFGIPDLLLNINGQDNYVFSAYADGYHSPTSHSSSIAYVFVSAGLSFSFGAIRHFY